MIGRGRRGGSVKRLEKNMERKMGRNRRRKNSNKKRKKGEGLEEYNRGIWRGIGRGG